MGKDSHLKEAKKLKNNTLWNRPKVCCKVNELFTLQSPFTCKD